MYEAFLFWPLAVIFLTYINGFINNVRFKKINLLRSCLLVIVLTYITYSSLFFLDRFLRIPYGRNISLASLFSANYIIRSGLTALFNILYNNFLVNLFPILAYPLQVEENLNMGGFIIAHARYLDKIIFLGSGIFIAMFLSVTIYLFRKKHFEVIRKLMFFIFLLFSELFVLFNCKYLVNPSLYLLTQFRFQYVPNAIFTLIALFLADRLLKLSKRKKVIYISLCLILILNIQAIKEGTSILNLQLAPLEKILFNIKTGIRNGSIGRHNKLYIDRDMPDYLPSLCWNIYMGNRFIKKGNYQWLFSRNEIEYFSESLKDAFWIIDKKDFSVIRKSSENATEKAIKVNVVENKAYIDLGKDKKYVNIGWFYIQQGRYPEAEKMFKKALELNPNNTSAYDGLGICYREQKRYQEAEARRPL
ncbi:MAG: tetratricopeptide repeat protein [Candidatus Omnitrophota bacterium]|nr:tetratricopeptide repeat protein [Candidatus Omnitrophota bacterium]